MENHSTDNNINNNNNGDLNLIIIISTELFLRPAVEPRPLDSCWILFQVLFVRKEACSLSTPPCSGEQALGLSLLDTFVESMEIWGEGTPLSSDFEGML